MGRKSGAYPLEVHLSWYQVLLDESKCSSMKGLSYRSASQDEGTACFSCSAASLPVAGFSFAAEPLAAAFALRLPSQATNENERARAQKDWVETRILANRKIQKDRSFSWMSQLQKS